MQVAKAAIFKIPLFIVKVLPCNVRFARDLEFLIFETPDITFLCAGLVKVFVMNTQAGDVQIQDFRTKWCLTALRLVLPD
jgi:hypothetical protein